MKEALLAMNRLVAQGLIQDYAIGGAVGASFYIEAVQTEDIDAFVFMAEPASGLVVLTPVYEGLIAAGGQVEAGHVRFGAWPLQILTDANALISEAITKAIATHFDEIPTRVFSAEHLCAVALQTGRTKDYLRVVMFLESGKVNLNALHELAERFALTAALARAVRMVDGA